MPLVLNNKNKKNHYEITTKPLKPRLKFLNGKSNEVITLLNSKKTKMLLVLNNNKKKHYEIIIKPLKLRLTNFNGRGNRILQVPNKKSKLL